MAGIGFNGVDDEDREFERVRAKVLRLAGARRAARKRLLKHKDFVVLLGWMRERFEVDLPCFQGRAGEYDELDAMRRDAYREVFMWLSGGSDEGVGSKV